MMLLFISMSSQAQTWSEFFNQKKTQKKYLLKQIVALEIYAGYLKDGYTIASKGLHSIESFTNGEFNLHDTFFNSLKAVSPVITNHGKVIDILKWQQSIKKRFSSLSKEMKSAGRKDYFETVRGKIMKECENDLEELLLLLSAGELEMSDDERLKRLEKIHDSMRDKYQFTHSFISQVHLLEKQMDMEKRSIRKVQEIYQIPN